jgi:4-hydroxythreonine-4-phosphate dehydrogenase
MRLRIGISLGDVTGVGPEVTLKALSRLAPEAPEADFTIIGDRHTLERCGDRLRLRVDLSGTIRVLNPHDPHLPDPLAPGARPAAAAAVEWIREGARLCLARELDALVTAPVNKHAIVKAGIPFVGHTELLSEMAGEPRTVMMLLGPDDKQRWLRVALATTHLALREVPLRLTRDKVQLAVERAARACADLGLKRARIGVCGLNPHAGEGGEFGDEEAVVIEPAIRRARAQGVDVVGPLSGDTAFHQALQGDYDAVVAMYHDQGLAPLKLAAFNTGVNWTLGLPFIRTSPDHGTAYDIAGKGTADPSSMLEAIRLALQLARRQPGPGP